MTDNITILTIEEHVKRRPAMYLGNKGAVSLFGSVIKECIKLCHTDDITFKITIKNQYLFSLECSSLHDLQPFVQALRSEEYSENSLNVKVLKILAEYFQVTVESNGSVKITFSFDKELTPGSDIDYLVLTEAAFFIALLHRKSHLVITDKRKKFLIQNYFHFPEGIFYLFQQAKKEALGTPQFQILFDDLVGTNHYQIGLAYRTDWFPQPHILSFANDVHTVCHGSLVEGVMNGLVRACKAYVKTNQLTSYKVTRKKTVNGLILVCAVKGPDYIYGGSFKETLEDDTVKNQAAKIVSELALEFFKNESEKAATFLWRFDTSILTHSMFG